MAGTVADAALRLTAPDVTPTELTAIAAAHPELRQAVAAHPNCHAELRAWIAQVAPPVLAPAGPPAPPVQPAPSVQPGPIVQQALAPESPTTAQPARLPWIVAAASMVVALVAVAALALGGSSAEPDGSGALAQDRGFASPEAAIEHVVEHVAAGDMAGATEAFAVRTMVDGYSFEAYTERVGAVMYDSWLPSSTDGYREINAGVRRGEVARQLRSLVQSVVAPDYDFGMTTTISDEFTAADMAADLAPDDLAGLSVVRIDLMSRPDEQYQENLQTWAGLYGADELRDMAILYDTPNGPAVGGMQLLRYGDEWHVQMLASQLMGTSIGGLEPITEQDYLDAVAPDEG